MFSDEGILHDGLSGESCVGENGGGEGKGQDKN